MTIGGYGCVSAPVGPLPVLFFQEGACNQAGWTLHRKIVDPGAFFLTNQIVPLTRGGGEMRTLFRIFFVVITAALIAGAAFSQSQTKSADVKAAAPVSPSPVSSDQISSNDASSRLPVKRVVLYKNGVGYFEHAARVHGNQELAIDFTTSQLNDVLKSLTVVDLGDGRISGVRYNSIAPLDERLKGLRLPFGEQITRTDFLSAMRGSRVEVRSKGETASGRLLSVEQEQRTTDSGTTYNVTEFSVMTGAGEMKNFELGPAVSVRLAEHDLNQEVGRYLDLVGFVARQGLAAHVDLGDGQRRPRHFCELHQRSAGVEEHLSHHLAGEGGREAAAARLGDCGQHDWRRLEGCAIVADRGRAAVVYSGHFAAAVWAQAGGSVAGSGDADATDAGGDDGGPELRASFACGGSSARRRGVGGWNRPRGGRPCWARLCR